MKKLLFSLLSFLLFSACTKEDFGISSVDNPYDGRLVSVYGETITVSFYAEAAWDAVLELSSEGDWAEIAQKRGADKAGTGRVQIAFSVNKDVQERTAHLYIQVTGKERMLVASFTQAAAGNSSGMSAYLNQYMHDILKDEYLWAEDYAALQVDMSLPYTEFLPAHLLSMSSNMEDGGVYRSYLGGLAGQRYIYSSIQELTSGATRSVQNSGLGFGPMYATVMPSGSYGLSVGYVHKDSPAYEAGMRRGDTIYEVNGRTMLTEEDYNQFYNELYLSPSGSYTLKFFRDAKLNSAYSATVSPASYKYDPVLYMDVIEYGDNKIGYAVLENFDYYSQDAVVSMIGEFAQRQITDLVLDLRYNQGGSVAQSRYLASAIAGAANLDKVFANLTYNDGSVDSWLFRGGPSDQDGLGIATDLGLDRLFVICSYGTASASELLITSLRGIDFPVYLFGGQTEGKNVGMTASTIEYKGRVFQFAPITFRLTNAKGFGDYSDGLEPDVVLNNQNSSTADDGDNMFPYAFGDWNSFHFNRPLATVFYNITGVVPASLQTRGDTVPMQPVGEISTWKKEPDRYGNMIYR